MLVAIPLKHKVPLRCRLHTIVFGRSISIAFARCNLGCKRKCKKCSGCERNIKEISAEGFREAFEKGLAAGVQETEEKPRYIDANAIKSVDYTGLAKIGAYDFINTAKYFYEQLVVNQPTAYDEEKVIEQLKDNAHFELFGIHTYYVPLSTAIEIVKGRGLNGNA